MNKNATRMYLIFIPIYSYRFHDLLQQKRYKFLTKKRLPGIYGQSFEWILKKENLLYSSFFAASSFWRDATISAVMLGGTTS